MTRVVVIKSPEYATKDFPPGTIGHLSNNGITIYFDNDSCIHEDDEWELLEQELDPETHPLVQNIKTGKVYQFLGLAKDATNRFNEIPETFAVYKDATGLHVRQRREFERKFQPYLVYSNE